METQINQQPLYFTYCDIFKTQFDNKYVKYVSIGSHSSLKKVSTEKNRFLLLFTAYLLYNPKFYQN